MDGRVRAGARVERGLDRGVIVQPRQAAVRDIAVSREGAADQDAAVDLDGYGVDVGVESRAGIEPRVSRTIAVQTRQVVAVRPARGGERAAGKHLAIRLHGDGVNGVVHTSVEARIDRT